MTDVVTVALIVGVSSIVVAAVPSYFARRAVKAATDTHKAVNSRLSELLALTRASSKAKGRLQERQKQAKLTGKKKKL